MRTVVLASLLLAACSSTPLSPHKIDIQQGNYVNQEMVAKLQPGMTRAQVRFVLGTPLVNDTFHSDRWDYVYRYQKSGEVLEQRRISAIFQGDKLEKVEGDVVPSTGLAAEAAGSVAQATAGAKAGDSRSTAADAARLKTPVASAPTSTAKPAIPGDVADSPSAEAAPKGKPVPVKRQAAQQEKGVTGKLLSFIGFGNDEPAGQAEAPAKPTVERLKGPAVARVQTSEASRPAASSEPKTSSEPRTIASGIEEDGKLRNREGKTIGEQLEDKFGFGSGLASDRPATDQDRQASASGGETKAVAGDGKWRNREGKTIMEQVREKFGFGSDEPEEAAAETATTEKAAEKAEQTVQEKKSGGFELRNREGKTITQQVKEKFGFGDDEANAEVEKVGPQTEVADEPSGTTRTKDTSARSKDSGFFDFRNREGKTVMEQLREKLSLEPPDQGATETVRSETVSRSREPESKTGGGTISADNYKPDATLGSDKSLKDKVLDIFGFFGFD